MVAGRSIRSVVGDSLEDGSMYYNSRGTLCAVGMGCPVGGK